MSRSAGNAISIWLQFRGIEVNPHLFRHTFIDRLRDMGCPREIRATLAGWGSKGMEGRYGFGFGLSTLARWVNAICDDAYKDVVVDIRSAGYDRALSVYECALIVVELISELGEPGSKEMLDTGRINRIDLYRGLRFAKKCGVVVVNKSRPARCKAGYLLTGVAVPRLPTAVSSKKRRSTRLRYDYRKKILALPLPVIFGEAQCFPCDESLKERGILDRVGPAAHRPMLGSAGVTEVFEDRMLQRMRSRGGRYVSVEESSGSAFRFGAYLVDPIHRTISLNDEVIWLGRVETKLALFLFQHGNILVTNEEIGRAVWGRVIDPNVRLISPFISVLRTKLALGPEHQVQLKAIRSVGYRLFLLDGFVAKSKVAREERSA